MVAKLCRWHNPVFSRILSVVELVAGPPMFSGSIVALITPMHEDGSVDWQSYDRLIHWHLEQGTDGLVVLGTTAESPVITADERVQMIKRAVELVSGKIPVIVGTGTNSTQSSIERSQEAEQLGADALLVVTPYYNRPPQEGLYQHFKAVAESTQLPIILYNVPARTGCDLLPETAARLAKISNIVSIKEATGSLERLDEYLALDCGLNLLSGDDGSCQAFMAKGGHGVISVASNIAPQQMRDLCELNRFEPTQAGIIQAQLAPLFDVLGLQSNPTAVKWAAHQMGLIPAGIRLPMIWLNEVYHQTVRDAMQQAGLID